MGCFFGDFANVDRIMDKQKRKKFISNFAKVTAFVLAFVFVLSFVSLKAFTGDNTAKYSGRLADAYFFVNDPEQTTDVMFLGNSDAYSAFVPTALWENYGITSAVSASPHQNVIECKNALQTMLKTQSPKVAVLEVDLLYEGDNDSAPDAGADRLTEFFNTSVNPDFFENSVKGKFTLFTYHNAWKYLNKNRAARYSHGYKYIASVYETEQLDYMKSTDEVRMPPSSNLSDLDDFVSFCKSKGISLIFAEVNSTESWSMAKHNAAAKIADSYGVEFVDFNLMYDELGIDITHAFRDNGYHVSYDTALKITDYMGERLVKDYAVTDHRDDEAYAEYWNAECESFKRENSIA